MFEEEYILSLLSEKSTDNKIKYINDKIKRKGVKYISISEYNYIRKLNNLPEIKIEKLRDLLYENYISYSDLEKETGISRAMICMVLRGSRNCTINKMETLTKCLINKNNKIKYSDLVG